MSALETISLNSLAPQENEFQQRAISSLEGGKVVYLPHLTFELLPNETEFLDPVILKPKIKNVSYDIQTGNVQGTCLSGEKSLELKEMLHRFALFSREILTLFFPKYLPQAIQGRTSYRPAETLGRRLSLLKDDSLLHVDSFPSQPVKGNRILRIFSNINPDGKSRVWKVGEPFSQVVNKMSPRLKGQLPGVAYLMRTLGITKGLRTLYDHYMLELHDAMKKDPAYQREVEQTVLELKAGSSWMVFTDLVSHAVLSGQFVLEQTYYIPPDAMYQEELSPLRVLEKALSKKLI